MTTLDRSSVPVILGALGLPHRWRCRKSIFASEPRYRRLRIVAWTEHVPVLRHPALRRLMQQHWQALRTHSSWSRA